MHLDIILYSPYIVYFQISHHLHYTCSFFFRSNQIDTLNYVSVGLTFQVDGRNAHTNRYGMKRKSIVNLKSLSALKNLWKWQFYQFYSPLKKIWNYLWTVEHLGLNAKSLQFQIECSIDPNWLVKKLNEFKRKRLDGVSNDYDDIGFDEHF